MGLTEDLKIVISGDPKKFNKALDEVQASTKRLEAGLSAAAKVSGVAFGALTGTITGLVMAYREQEIQEQKTQRLLEQTGNASGIAAQKVFEYAAALQETSIYGDEVILESQNILLGLAKLSEDGFKKASQASLDLAAFMGGDLTSASQVLGKALANPAEGLSALSRSGIKFTNEQERMIKAMSDSGNIAGAQAKILETLELKYGGLAKANTEGTGKFIQLKNAIGDVGEEIGRQLTPPLSKLAALMIPFFQNLAKDDGFTKSAAATLIFATALTGLIAGAAVVVNAFVKLRAVILAARAALAAVTLTAGLWVAAIGLIAIAIVDLALNWDKRVAQMKAAWMGFLSFVQVGAAGLNTVLYGIATFSMERIKKGLDEMSKAAQAFSESYDRSMQKSGQAPQLGPAPNPNGSGNKGEEENQAKSLTSLTLYLERRKALEDEYAIARAEAQMTYDQQEQLMDLEHKTLLVEAANEFRKAELEGKIADNVLDVEQELAFQTQMQEMRNELHAAELNAERAVALEKAQIQQKADLQYLKDKEKFGVAYAKINKAIGSEQVQGAASAAGDLVELQQSTNSTLKGIGKAAAIADITIKTAQAAMNIYNGFSAIPIVGPALGIAGAAAAVLFGAEKIRNVTAAADGGVMTGGRRGIDSIPTMTMPGELITPTRNFDEVVNAVADSRLAARGEGSGAGGGDVHVVVGFTEDAFRLIEQKLIERGTLRTS